MGSSDEKAPAGLNRAAIGRTYQGAPVVADAESMAAYARATSDDNPWYLDPGRPGGVVAPPMYAARLFKEVLFKPLTDPEVKADLLMLLHGQQEMRFHHLIRPGDLIHTGVEIAEIIDKETGQILILRMVAERDEQTVCDARATLFIRYRQKRTDGPARPRPPAEAAPAPSWIFEEPTQVDADQSRRYAEASLDDNPIHVDEATARAAGLPGVVLQGLCTMALCQRAVVNRLAQGDPRRLARLQVRFSRPVFPGDTVTIQGRLSESGKERSLFGLRAINQEGAEVITDGVAEVATGKP